MYKINCTQEFVHNSGNMIISWKSCLIIEIEVEHDERNNFLANSEDFAQIGNWTSTFSIICSTDSCPQSDNKVMFPVIIVLQHNNLPQKIISKHRTSMSPYFRDYSSNRIFIVFFLLFKFFFIIQVLRSRLYFSFKCN